jgi:HSP20 family protein
MLDMTRWSDTATFGPFAELADIAEAFDRAFAELGFPAGVAGERSLLETGVAPEFRVAPERDGWHVAIDLPGIGKDSLKVECLGETVTVEGEWPEPAVDEGARAWRLGRPRGRFVRTFTLGEPIDAAASTARLEHGVLHLKVKKAAGAKSRTIKVRG